MVRVRVGARELEFPESRWEAMVSEGQVPPDALVFSLSLTGGLWRRADTLELYGFFRRTGEEDRREAGLPTDSPAPFAELHRVAFPRRGFSATELLVGINLLVAVVLLFLWGPAEYTNRIFGDLSVLSTRGYGLAWDLYYLWVDHFVPVGFVATIFIHAGFRHLTANLLVLVPAAAFTEYLYGRRVVLFYLVTGIAGAIVSFVVKERGPMSVGASGAIYGLIGVLVGFVLRHYRRLPRWHRWRARRVWVPLLILATLPSIINADWRAHVGGFLSGVVVGLLARMGRRGRQFLLPRSSLHKTT